DHPRHRGDEERRHPEREQRHLQRVAAAGDQHEGEHQTRQSEEAQLRCRRHQRPESRDHRRVGERHREDDGVEERVEDQLERGATRGAMPCAYTFTRPSGKLAADCASSHFLTAKARSSDSFWLWSALPWLSVWPWISTMVPPATTRSLNSFFSSSDALGENL